MKKELYVRNGIVLALTTLLIRSIGMVFRIFLCDTLGAEGMGLYQLILSVYIVFAAVSSSGVSLCATRLYADHIAAGDGGKALYAVRRCLLFSMLTGIMAGGLLLLSAEPIAAGILHDQRAATSLRILAPSLPFLAVSACIRGYFLARRKTLPASAEQFLEQVLEIGCFMLLFSVQKPQTLSDACAMTVTGTTIAEVLSLIFSLGCYYHDKKRLDSRSVPFRGLWRQMLPVFLPVSANACLRSGLSAAENALIPVGLQRWGYTEKEALSRYGVISGMSMMVLVFPSVLILPFAALIVSEIAEVRVRRHTKSVRHISEVMLIKTLQFALPVTVLFLFYAEPLCLLLFKNAEAGKYLSLLAPVIPFMYLDSVVDALLKGLNEQTGYFIFNTIDSVVRVLLTIFLLPIWGIYGVIVVIIVSELLNTLLSLWRLVSVTRLRLSFRRHILLPLALMLLPCLLLRLLPSIGYGGWDVIFRIGTACLFYAAALYAGQKCRLSAASLGKKTGETRFT